MIKQQNNIAISNDDFVYLALGTNLGDRKQNLLEAISLLERNNIKIVEVSPIYITPALLLIGSPNEWNIPFYNCVVKVDTNINPMSLLKICKDIEKTFGRDFSRKWSPRQIDIDILFYKNQNIKTDILEIPHREIYNRNFVLDPLSFIYHKKAINYYREGHQPIIMGILNITPDSFSDGGKYNNTNKFIETFELWEKNMVPIIDIGAESTRPNAQSLNAQEEIERLEPIFDYIKNRKFDKIKPLLSIDTYHSETAELAIKNGFNIINDVSGFNDKKMLDLAQNNKNIKFIFMHNLGIPTNKEVTIKDNLFEEIDSWLENKIKIFEEYKIEKNQLIFDPGIGFGKIQSQNLQILQNIEYFHKYGFIINVGHSRKSFMKIFSDSEPIDRDPETIAISIKISKNVDILRVHSPIEHMNALLAYNHMADQYV